VFLHHAMFLFAKVLLALFSLQTLSSVEMTSFYDIVEKDLNGNDVLFSQFRGKIVYIVNVASQCGYTASNYKLLRDLKRYREHGLELVIFPCNQFGKQEPGDEGAISQFASSQEFEGIVMTKADVNGAQTRPTFKFLKEVTGRGDIRW